MPWLSCIVSNVFLAMLLALAAWFAQRWLRWHGVSHILWVLVLVKLVTPPLVSVSLYESPYAACRNGTCGCGRHVPDPSDGNGGLGATLPWVLLTVWSVGALAMSWLAWCRWLRLRRLMSHGASAPPEWQALAARLAAELSLRRPPEVLAVPGRLPPLVVSGWGRPRMLLPVALMNRLDDSQRTVLLLHELFHLKRRDHLVRILELAVSVAYWWLPMVNLIGRNLRACEEACCDAAVTFHEPNARRDYARLLLDVLDFVSPLPRAAQQATALNSAHDLERRLRTILAVAQKPPRRWLVGVCAVGLACGVVPFELRYDWSGRLAPAATPAELQPASEPGCLPNADRRDVAKAYCCPS
jgi:beta-lactamase regulating signal transducer with metallopeptidase domain